MLHATYEAKPRPDANRMGLSNNGTEQKLMRIWKLIVASVFAVFLASSGTAQTIYQQKDTLHNGAWTQGQWGVHVETTSTLQDYFLGIFVVPIVDTGYAHSITFDLLVEPGFLWERSHDFLVAKNEGALFNHPLTYEDRWTYAAPVNGDYLTVQEMVNGWERHRLTFEFLDRSYFSTVGDTLFLGYGSHTAGGNPQFSRLGLANSAFVPPSTQWDAAAVNNGGSHFSGYLPDLGVTGWYGYEFNQTNAVPEPSPVLAMGFFSVMMFKSVRMRVKNSLRGLIMRCRMMILTFFGRIRKPFQRGTLLPPQGTW